MVIVNYSPRGIAAVFVVDYTFFWGSPAECGSFCHCLAVFAQRGLQPSRFSGRRNRRLGLLECPIKERRSHRWLKRSRGNWTRKAFSCGCLGCLAVCFSRLAMRHPTLGRYSFVAADPFDFIEVPADGSDALRVLGDRLRQFSPQYQAEYSVRRSPREVGQRKHSPGLPPFQGAPPACWLRSRAKPGTLPLPTADEFRVPAWPSGCTTSSRPSTTSPAELDHLARIPRARTLAPPAPCREAARRVRGIGSGRGHATAIAAIAARMTRSLPAQYSVARRAGRDEQFLEGRIPAGGPAGDRLHRGRRRVPSEPLAAAAAPPATMPCQLYLALAPLQSGAVRRLLRFGRVSDRQCLAGAIPARCGPRGRDPADQGHAAAHRRSDLDRAAEPSCWPARKIAPKT